MKNKLMLTALLGLLLVGSFAYAEESDDEAKKRLLKEYEKVQKEREKEAERKEEFIQEKANLEKEVKELKEKQLGREELYAKLKEDSKIRWHREEYKKLLKRFDEYYNKLEQKIADKEQQIVELTKLLEVLN